MPSLYEISIPLFIRALKNLSAILKKAEEHASSKNLNVDDYVNARLIDDMNPFSFQIQTACNTPKNLLKRVAGVELPAVEDNETTFKQLQERLEKAVEMLEGVDAKALDGKEDEEVEFLKWKFTGESYLLTFAIPNFYFHVSTAYGILRKEGVPIGKLDFIGDQ